MTALAINLAIIIAPDMSYPLLKGQSAYTSFSSRENRDAAPMNFQY